MFEQLLEIAAPYGPSALFLLYFVWRDEKRDKREEARELRRETLEKERIDADIKVAVAMTLLAERHRQ